jgi:hypothetical protein
MWAWAKPKAASAQRGTRAKPRRRLPGARLFPFQLAPALALTPPPSDGLREAFRARAARLALMARRARHAPFAKLARPARLFPSPRGRSLVERRATFARKRQFMAYSPKLPLSRAAGPRP